MMRILIALLFLVGCTKGNEQPELDAAQVDGFVFGKTAPDGGTSVDLSDSDASPAGDLAPAPDLACTQVTHSDGLGQTWTDCNPLGTYSKEQAHKACEAFIATLDTSLNAVCNDASVGACFNKEVFVYASGGPYPHWDYAGNFSGMVFDGNCVAPETVPLGWN